MLLRLALLDSLSFFKNGIEFPLLVPLLTQGERDLPEVSRRDLDLLIAEEDEAILLEEQGRPVWQCGMCLVLDSQALGVGSWAWAVLSHPSVL